MSLPQSIATSRTPALIVTNEPEGNDSASLFTNQIVGAYLDAAGVWHPYRPEAA